MNIYLDTEFIEGFRRPFFNLFGKKRHYIDLISIGLVTDTGKTYYAICKEFEFNDASEWVRENVLRPLFHEMKEMCADRLEEIHLDGYWSKDDLLTAHNFHLLLSEVGKSREQIAREIVEFVNADSLPEDEKLSFYGYFADYDWVLFCSLFGLMIDLPNRFPMFCMDLKQMMEENNLDWKWKKAVCPDPVKEHNALVDAQWNKRLHRAIKKSKVDLSFESLPLALLPYTKGGKKEAKIIPHPGTPQQYQETYPQHGDQTLRHSGGQGDSDGTLLHPPVA